MSKDTVPEVFIVESLHEDDVETHRVGHIIEQVLLMYEMKPKYKYVKTFPELRDAMNEFSESNYRYLHLSFHGDENSFEAQFGDLPFNHFPQIDHILKGKRVFISSCKVVNHHNHVLANVLLHNTGCTSLVGSYEDISFNDAALMWSTFYYLCFRDQTGDIKIRRDDIVGNLKKLTRLFRLNLNYYSYSNNNGIKLTQFQKGNKKEL